MKQKTVSPAGSRTAPWLVLAAAAGLLDQAAKDTVERMGDDQFPQEPECLKGRVKLHKNHNDGLPFGAFRQYPELVRQVPLAAFWAAFGVFAYFFAGGGMVESSSIWIPVFDVTFDLGVFYIPFVMFVMIAFSNSVNLTDGLDGLASGITAMVAFFLLLAGLRFGFADLPLVAGAVSGGCLGFLMYNKNPARIFMGDTGSMALGGVLAAGALMMKLEFLLVIAGLIYVLEALSVIIQVTYFKKTHKRIFKMAPLHHHFELCGMSERKVVAMFWAVAFVCCALAIVLMGI